MSSSEILRFLSRLHPLFRRMYVYNLVRRFRRIFPVGRSEAQQIIPSTIAARRERTMLSRREISSLPGSRISAPLFWPAARSPSMQTRSARDRAAITKDGRNIPPVNEGPRETPWRVVGAKKPGNRGCEAVEREFARVRDQVTSELFLFKSHRGYADGWKHGIR